MVALAFSFCTKSQPYSSSHALIRSVVEAAFSGAPSASLSSVKTACTPWRSDDPIVPEGGGHPVRGARVAPVLRQLLAPHQRRQALPEGVRAGVEHDPCPVPRAVIPRGRHAGTPGPAAGRGGTGRG